MHSNSELTHLFYFKADRVIHQTVLAEIREEIVDSVLIIKESTVHDGTLGPLTAGICTVPLGESQVYTSIVIILGWIYSGLHISLSTQCIPRSFICLYSPEGGSFEFCLVLSFIKRVQHSFIEPSVVHPPSHHRAYGNFSLWVPHLKECW